MGMMRRKHEADSARESELTAIINIITMLITHNINIIMSRTPRMPSNRFRKHRQSLAATRHHNQQRYPVHSLTQGRPTSRPCPETEDTKCRQENSSRHLFEDDHGHRYPEFGDRPRLIMLHDIRVCTQYGAPWLAWF